MHCVPNPVVRTVAGTSFSVRFAVLRSMAGMVQVRNLFLCNYAFLSCTYGLGMEFCLMYIARVIPRPEGVHAF